MISGGRDGITGDVSAAASVEIRCRWSVSIATIKPRSGAAKTAAAGAVADALRQATGIRVRRFPIRIEYLVRPASNVLDL